MGEIGTPRREYLYELRYIDLLMIERGYDRRHRHPWAIARWMTYNIMAAFCGGDNLASKGMHGPKDLLPFPWEQEPRTKVTPDDVAQLQAEMAAINAAQ